MTVRSVLDCTGNETGMYSILVGERRFLALEMLVKQKRLNVTDLVPRIVRDLWAGRRGQPGRERPAPAAATARPVPRAKAKREHGGTRRFCRRLTSAARRLCSAEAAFDTCRRTGVELRHRAAGYRVPRDRHAGAARALDKAGQPVRRYPRAVLLPAETLSIQLAEIWKSNGLRGLVLRFTVKSRPDDTPFSRRPPPHPRRPMPVPVGRERGPEVERQVLPTRPDPFEPD